VGPTLPAAAVPSRKHPIMLPPPTYDAIPGVEPEAKRPRVEAVPTYLPPPIGSITPALPDVPFAVASTPLSLLATVQIELMSEADFVASLAKATVTLQIRIPNDPSQIAWNFYGQIVSISIEVMKTVKSVKEEIARAHLNGMPVNKMQLKNAANGSFLKDTSTLAALNIGPTATLELVPRARGGRKV
jgi:hypothetical protein